MFAETGFILVSAQKLGEFFFCKTPLLNFECAKVYSQLLKLNNLLIAGNTLAANNLTNLCGNGFILIFAQKPGEFYFCKTPVIPITIENAR